MSTKKTLFAVASTLALVFAMAAPINLMADDWDKATKLTFSESVEVPGVVLTVGTYWFTLADNDSDRNIVQIWNEDRTRLVTTILAIPDYRLKPTDKTVIHFEERPSDQPEAIHSWFYPGANCGEEFVYPKPQSRAKRQMDRAQKEHYLNEKIKAIEKELGRDLRTGQAVRLKLADGNVIQGKIADTDANGIWLDVDKSLWVTLTGTEGRVQFPSEMETGALRCFVPFSSMAWLMTTTASRRLNS